MLTPPLQEIRSAIMGMRLREKSIDQVDRPYIELLDVLEQLDFLEADLSKAFEEGGLPAAARVVVKPGEPDCQICGRTIVPGTV
ncbi:MAG: hypothetical protein DI535_14345 [Citrobacter freundii]|nr:MAG: hypothetical protein DI535_14345 [Citrobacter freundii]